MKAAYLERRATGMTHEGAILSLAREVGLDTHTVRRMVALAQETDQVARDQAIRDAYRR